MRHADFSVGTGLSTLMMVLLILTLSVFSALTLTSARADLSLSQINADTVTAYYAADRLAAELYADFAAGTDVELDTAIHMTDTQSLRLHLMRENGAVRILAWHTVSAQEEPDGAEGTLPVWDGTSPQ